MRLMTFKALTLDKQTNSRGPVRAIYKAQFNFPFQVLFTKVWMKPITLRKSMANEIVSNPPEGIVEPCHRTDHIGTDAGE